MKHNKKLIKIIITILIISITTSGFAQAFDIQSSDRIKMTTASSQSNSNGITVYFSITAKNTMIDLGAATIYIKNSSGTIVKSYTYSAYPSMMGHNQGAYSGSVTYTGCTSGHQYYAVVYFRATDSTGSETKKQTTNTVTAP